MSWGTLVGVLVIAFFLVLIFGFIELLLWLYENCTICRWIIQILGVLAWVSIAKGVVRSLDDDDD